MPGPSRSGSRYRLPPRAVRGAGVVDTSLPSPEDIVEEDQGPRVPVLQIYRVQAHSLIILVSEATHA